MDRRGLFLMVFVFTLVSTILVALVSFLTQQEFVHAVLYSLFAMWVSGVVSMLVAQQLYLGIIRPLEERKLEAMLAKAEAEINIDEVEEIDQVKELEEAKRKAEAVTAGNKS